MKSTATIPPSYSFERPDDWDVPGIVLPSWVWTLSQVHQCLVRSYYRDHLVACRAQLNGVDAPTPEETDKHMEGIQAFAKQALAGASAAMLFTSSMEAAVAYPIFAQQNYANPREYTGKIVCANCHLASKPIEVRLPQAVLPDTIFKMEVEVPAKYAKRRQPLADGSKGPMNIGAIAVMPEGWKLAPKDRLPKPLKKEMKGLAWAPYSKETSGFFRLGWVSVLSLIWC